MRAVPSGTRLRERRLALGLRQADLARSAGISATYLNLIEHNRRRVSPDLLARLALGLGIAPAALEEGAGPALIAGLREIASGEPEAEAERLEDFVTRFPGWAGALAARQARLAELERRVVTLSDRLSQDPHLADTLHAILSAVASLRAAAGILAETPDLEPEWRAQFARTVDQESLRLSESAGALAAYLGESGAGETALAAPQEELEAWLAAEGWDVARHERLPETAELSSAEGRALAARHLARAQADARALPDPAAARQTHGAPDLIAEALGLPLDLVLRRLGSLPGAGLLLADGSGTLTLRRPLAGFEVPRFGAACALWPLFTALRRPFAPLRAVVETPGTSPRRFTAWAVATLTRPLGLDGPELAEATMLLWPAPEAGAGAPIGPACRICPRRVCPARREASMLREG